MESLILIAETSLCVALVATVREGMRRKSDALMAITLLLLIPAVTILLSEIMTDRHARNLQFGQTPFDQEERERAREKVSREWQAATGTRFVIECVFPEPPPADATAPEN